MAMLADAKESLFAISSSARPPERWMQQSEWDDLVEAARALRTVMEATDAAA